MTELRNKSICREDCLARYKRFMCNTKGLAEATQRKYLLIASRFLKSLSKRRLISASKFTAAAIADFVRADAENRTGQGPNTTISATRAFLRFLRSEGVVERELELAVPRLRCHAYSALPAVLSKDEISSLLEGSGDGSEKGIRNLAVLLLIARLGLRIDEVAKLTIDDIDWRNGVVLIRAGKNRRERSLPLADDIGKALLKYLKHSRPRSRNRHIFIKYVPPFNEYNGSSLGKVVKRILAKSGMKSIRGAHGFRHAAASAMVNEGASFKQIADLMGHQSMASTAIYAKLDLRSLAGIALPWPGGDQ